MIGGALCGTCSAQSILDKTLSVDLQKVRLDQVLQTMSNKGHFYFSYNSSILRSDSIVTIAVREKTVKQILDLLFRGNLEYVENGNHIILRHAPPQVPEGGGPGPQDKGSIIRGIILDSETGQAVAQASIYDKQSLSATLSDKNGTFHFKAKSERVSLTVSKDLYEDTTVQWSQAGAHHLAIYISLTSFSRREVMISPDNTQGDTILQIAPSTMDGPQEEPIRVELTPFGKFILSTRLRAQTINLSKFFTTRPVQVSFLPGLSTNGPLNSQIENNFSLNVLGGYAAGLNGFEVGGLFNIDKRQVRGFQAAGLLNNVGKTVTGMQAAGLHNTVLDTVQGVQIAGISNYSHTLLGFQAAGILNIIRDTVRGAQIAGISNYSHTLLGFQAAGILNFIRDTVRGVQLAGILNSSRTVGSGLQLAGIINHTHHLSRGSWQIGLINTADSSDGYSIGLFNFVRTGYRSLSVFADEVSPLNLAFRSGNLKLYSILIAGFNPDQSNRFYRLGFGLGHMIPLGRSGALSLRPELTSEFLALPDTTHPNSTGANFNINFTSDLLLEKLHLDLHWQPNKWFALSAGPSFSLFIKRQTATSTSQPYIPHEMYPHYKFSDNLTGWLGWQVSIQFL
jgi:hypothetical protein